MRRRISQVNPDTGEREEILVDFTREEVAAHEADVIIHEAKKADYLRREAVRELGRAKLHAAAGLTAEESELQY